MGYRPQVSIAASMGLVVMAAIGIAALKYPSESWAGSIFCITLAILGCAAVLAVIRRGRARAAWAGMAIFGLLYIQSAFRGDVEYPALPTAALLDRLVAALAGGSGRPIYLSHPAGQGGYSYRVLVPAMRYVPVAHFDLVAYRQVGHSLLALISGGLGAIFGMVASLQREPAEA